MKSPAVDLTSLPLCGTVKASDATDELTETWYERKERRGGKIPVSTDFGVHVYGLSFFILTSFPSSAILLSGGW